MAGDKRWLLFLVGAYLTVFAVCAVSPTDRVTWWAENATVWVFVGWTALLYAKGVRFSRTAYTLMTLFFCLHTIGGHYTFSEVPFGWVSDCLGAERNHYDRLCHFMVGVFALPIYEWVRQRCAACPRGLAYGVGWLGIVAFAGLFEIFEWLYAVCASPDAGVAFLGSQGDPWDAQKDMLADTLGATVTLGVHGLITGWRAGRPASSADRGDASRRARRGWRRPRR